VSKLRFPVLDPDKAYIGGSLFLPRSKVSEGAIRSSLTFGIDPADEPRVFVIEHPHHLEVPRNFKTLDVLQRWRLQVVDLRPTSFSPSSLRVKPGFCFRAHQIPAWEAMREAAEKRQDMTLRLDTGRGKTIMALRLAAEIGGALLVVSWQEAHLRNWEKDLHSLFHLDGKVGWIRGKQLQFDKEVVFCTVQTLAKRMQAGVLPPSFFRRFALTVYDEVHHQAARWFCTASEVSAGLRLGLTATLKRKDRCEGIITAQIGQVIYDDPAEDALEPEVYLNKTGVSLADDDPDMLDVNGEFSVPLMRSKLATLEARHKVIIKVAEKRLREGRKVYVASHSKDLAYEIEKRLRKRGHNPGLITGDEKDADARLSQLNNHDVVVVTVGVGKEAYNRVDLSSLLLVTPIPADSYAPTEWLQLVGRILRPAPGKPKPVVDLFLDDGVTKSRGMTLSVVRWCNTQGWNVLGDSWQQTQRVWRA
jgi:superfamily II DNA or RNA helicase